jgi:hypothetical protein
MYLLLHVASLPLRQRLTRVPLRETQGCSGSIGTSRRNAPGGKRCFPSALASEAKLPRLAEPFQYVNFLLFHVASLPLRQGLTRVPLRGTSICSGYLAIKRAATILSPMLILAITDVFDLASSELERVVEPVPDSFVFSILLILLSSFAS